MDFNCNKKGPPMMEVFFCNGGAWGDYVIAMIWLSRLLS